jgi:hypothetical protein
VELSAGAQQGVPGVGDGVDEQAAPEKDQVQPSAIRAAGEQQDSEAGEQDVTEWVGRENGGADPGPQVGEHLLEHREVADEQQRATDRQTVQKYPGPVIGRPASPHDHHLGREPTRRVSGPRRPRASARPTVMPTLLITDPPHVRGFDAGHWAGSVGSR